MPREKADQDHFNDLGDDLSGLGSEASLAEMDKDTSITHRERPSAGEHSAESFLARTQFGT